MHFRIPIENGVCACISTWIYRNLREYHTIDLNKFSNIRKAAHRPRFLCTRWNSTNSLNHRNFVNLLPVAAAAVVILLLTAPRVNWCCLYVAFGKCLHLNIQTWSIHAHCTHIAGLVCFYLLYFFVFVIRFRKSVQPAACIGGFGGQNHSKSESCTYKFQFGDYI